MERSLLALLIIVSACKADPRPDFTPASETINSAGELAIANTTTAPVVTPNDKQYADVFRPLDGTWEGEFRIYVDTRGQQDGPARPTDLDPKRWQSPPFELSQTIDVRQVYTSESPYFQRVKITDTYADGRVVESSGVNKIQGGTMWCVVRKPDELVIHEGATDGPRTIIWSRNSPEPKAIEWFHETVRDETYTIIGWGYYGSDDPQKSPRMFFHGEYRRVSNQ